MLLLLLMLVHTAEWERISWNDKGERKKSEREILLYWNESQFIWIVCETNVHMCYDIVWIMNNNICISFKEFMGTIYLNGEGIFF